MTQLEDWIGKQRDRKTVIDAQQARKLAVTLDKPVPEDGEQLLECWHWAWFNDEVPASKLGRDGHPERGDFLPPVPLPRRMWAGGDITYLRPILIGQEITKRSTIKDVKHKKGSTGELCIVSVEHVLSHGNDPCISEIQNLVFREDPKPEAQPVAAPEPPNNAELVKTFSPDAVLMFRYSALTFNGHRIHFDVDYARNVEGYPDLVFHAPLTATMLQEAAAVLLDSPIRSFNYRATAPLFCNAEIRICAKRQEGNVIAWAENPSGGQAMIAEAKS